MISKGPKKWKSGDEELINNAIFELENSHDFKVLMELGYMVHFIEIKKV